MLKECNNCLPPIFLPYFKSVLLNFKFPQPNFFENLHFEILLNIYPVSCNGGEY
jgi:hypothetical protein